MAERSRIVLDEEDIKEMIARKYYVDTNNVEINISEGDPQYPGLSICVVVNL